MSKRYTLLALALAASLALSACKQAPNSAAAAAPAAASSASATEFRGFVQDGLAAIDAKGTNPDSPEAISAAAKARQAKGDWAGAAKEYARVVEVAPADWPRRSEALMGWVFSLSQADDNA